MSSSTHVIVVLDRETEEYMRALLLYSTYTVVVVYPVINSYRL